MPGRPSNPRRVPVSVPQAMRKTDRNRFAGEVGSWPIPAYLRYSLNIAVWDVPSVTAAIPSVPRLYRLAFRK